MGKKILIADDEPNIVVSLEFLMKQRGYVVKVANNGEDALDAIGEFAPGPGAARRDDAADERLRPVPEGAREPGLAGHQDHHAVGQGARHRGDQGHGGRRRRLRDQAVLDQGPDRQGRARCWASRRCRTGCGSRWRSSPRGDSSSPRSRAAALLVGADLADDQRAVLDGGTLRERAASLVVVSLLLLVPLVVHPATRCFAAT